MKVRPPEAFLAVSITERWWHKTVPEVSKLMYVRKQNRLWNMPLKAPPASISRFQTFASPEPFFPPYHVDPSMRTLWSTPCSPHVHKIYNTDKIIFLIFATLQRRRTSNIFNFKYLTILFTWPTVLFQPATRFCFHPFSLPHTYTCALIQYCIPFTFFSKLHGRIGS